MKINILEEIENITPKYKRKYKKPDSRPNVVGDDSPIRTKDKYARLDESSKTWKGLLFLILLLSAFFIFTGRVFELQVIKGGDNLYLSQGNSIRSTLIQAQRGLIYDRNGNIIVRNKPAFSLILNTAACKSIILCEISLNNISSFVGLDKTRILSELQSGKTEIVLSSNMSKDEILPVEVNISKYLGVSVEISPERDYMYKDVFSHLIGYVGYSESLLERIVGKVGVELQYDALLSGISGSKVVQVDSAGKVLKILSENPSIPGKNITLYVDMKLQKSAYELLKKVVDDKKARGGAVVAQDPNTGGILALVSYPAFDPNRLSGGISYEEYRKLVEDVKSPFFNRAVSGQYPPGSVFKLVMASAVLAEKIASSNFQINDTGSIQIGNYVYKGWKAGGHGLVDLRRALQVSNDVYFYIMGGGYQGVKGLGIENISKWAKKFGYGRTTDIDINGEATGFVPDGKSRAWYLGDTYITSIGQGDVLATPLQVNNATSYFANGGVLYRPKVVKSIEGEELDPEVVSRDLIDENSYEVVREGMKMAVLPGGTAYPLFDFSQRHDGIALAGKTGTSEFGETGIKGKTHAWFTVFGPYDNPNIALTVFLEGGGSGADDAAPIAKELLDVWFSNK